MTKISKGKRAHLLALCDPAGAIMIRAHNRMHWPMVRARQSLKRLERAARDEVTL